MQPLEPRWLLSIADFTEYRGANAQHQFGGNSDDMPAWNVNLVRETVQLFDRAPFGYNSIQSGSSWYHGLQGVVDRNRANGITTILCPFSWNGSAILGATPSQTSYWTAFNNRLYQMAEQFKDQSDVWIEFWNEPYAWDKPTDANQWAFDMEVMIGSVRSAGNMNKIVVPGGMMGGDETVVISRGEDLLEFDPAHNLVFDIHAYNYWFDKGYASMDQRMQNMAGSGLDYVFGEFGAGTPGGVFDVSPFLTAARKYRVGALAWMWGGVDGDRLFLDDGSLNSNAGNYYWAEKARDYMLGSTSILPAGWAIHNIDIASPVGVASYSAETYTLKGSGRDIWGTSDQCLFVNQELGGSQVLTARADSLQNTDPWAKAGLMIRSSADANAPFVMLQLTPGNGIHLQARSSTGGAVVDLASAPGSAGVWLRLVRNANEVTAFFATTPAAPTDADWVQLGAPQTVTFSEDLYLGGLAVTSHSPGNLATSTFSSVSFRSLTGLPVGWHGDDIGGAAARGITSHADGVYSLSAAGAGLSGSADQFHCASQEAEGDVTFIAHVDSLEAGATAGIVLRDSRDPASAYAALLLTPTGLQLQARRQSAGTTSPMAKVSVQGPLWLRLRRLGDNIDAWYSKAINPAADNFTLLGSVDAVRFTSYWSQAGLAMASGNGTTLRQATVSGVDLAASTGLPTGWTNQDIGSVGPAGSASHQGSALFAAGQR